MFPVHLFDEMSDKVGKVGSLETYVGEVFEVRYFVQEDIVQTTYGFLTEVTKKSITILTQHIIVDTHGTENDSNQIKIKRSCIHSMTLLDSIGVYLTLEICGEVQYEVNVKTSIERSFLDPKISVINTGEDNATS